jgi:hypothetical protein
MGVSRRRHSSIQYLKAMLQPSKIRLYPTKILMDQLPRIYFALVRCLARDENYFALDVLPERASSPLIIVPSAVIAFIMAFIIY